MTCITSGSDRLKQGLQAPTLAPIRCLLSPLNPPPPPTHSHTRCAILQIDTGHPVASYDSHYPSTYHHHLLSPYIGLGNWLIKQTSVKVLLQAQCPSVLLAVGITCSEWKQEGGVGIQSLHPCTVDHTTFILITYLV